MGTDRFFSTLKDVLLLTEEVKRLNNQTEKLTNKVEDINNRLIRIETMAELSTKNRLPEK